MIKVRLVSLSTHADELAREQAAARKMEPEIYASLVLEMAIRERHALDQEFAKAADQVDARPA